MQKFQKAFLFLTSIYLVSCAPQMFQSLKPAGDSYRPEHVRLFTNDTSESMVYKTNLDYRGKPFSSLIYLKKTGDSTYSMVLMTTFGNTMLEGTFSKDKFVFKNVVSYLNQTPLLSLLEHDWRLLLRGNLFNDQPQLFSSDAQQTVYYFGDGKSDGSLYYYSQGKESVEMIESYSGKTKKAILNIDRMNPKNPEVITIEHPGMGLKIEMTRLKTPTDDSVE
jgi:hypothetical protein